MYIFPTFLKISVAQIGVTKYIVEWTGYKFYFVYMYVTFSLQMLLYDVTLIQISKIIVILEL